MEERDRIYIDFLFKSDEKLDSRRLCESESRKRLIRTMINIILSVNMYI